MSMNKNKLAVPSNLQTEDRGHWGSRAEFILSCIGYSVGLGNVWRFPFLAYENGGGAFLIPYVIILILVGKPIYFMEAAIGQYAQVGPLTMWKQLLPGSVGIGAAMVIISLIVAIYYNVIMAYCLYYLFNSFNPVLPWSVCDEKWGADQRCYVRSANTSLDSLEGQCIIDELGGCEEISPQTSTEQFWEKSVLHIDLKGLKEFGDLGEFQYHLAFCLALSWAIVSLCVMKGVKSTGKVVYFTATFPYVVLLILLVQGLCLEGASQGLAYLFVPDWSKLADIGVWRAAAGQVFFSLGISWGGIIMFGSYNHFSARVHIDAHIVSAADFLTSIIASVVIFSTLGHSAYNLGVPIQKVAKGGQGLAFVAYPEALSLLPAANFWCIIFFFMLFLLGLDSEFALFETALCSIYDAFPSLRRKKPLVTLIMSFICFLLGLPCIFTKGQFVLDIMDTYGASISVMVIAIFEMITVMWIYGVKNFCEDMKVMLGFTPSLYFKVCWSFVCPLLLTCIFIAACVFWKLPSYGSIQYPGWAHGIGMGLAAISIIQIPLWFFIIGLNEVCKGRQFMNTFRTTNEWLSKTDAKVTNSCQKIPDSIPQVVDSNYNNNIGYSNATYQSEKDARRPPPPYTESSRNPMRPPVKPSRATESQTAPSIEVYPPTPNFIVY